MSPVPTKGLGFDGNGTIERECLQQSVYVISAVGLNNMRGPDVIYKRIPWLSLIKSKFRITCKKKSNFKEVYLLNFLKENLFKSKSQIAGPPIGSGGGCQNLPEKKYLLKKG